MKILVIGAGIAGLCTALALSGRGDEITLIEKDEPPPKGGPDEAFADWKRTGVGHMRQSHAFLARLRTLIKNSHPELLQALKDAGCRELNFADNLPEWMKAKWVPQEGDDDLAVLTSRRTTLEWVIRRYVGTLPGVTIRSGVFAKEAIIETAPGGRRVAGVRTETEEIRADVTVDAGGRLSAIPEQLEAAGAVIGDEREACGILYYTRHYRLRPGQSEPPRDRAQGTGDLGFVKFGLFPGDNGCFSVTIAVPEIEEELRKAVMKPETFDAICRMMPGLVRWIEPERAEPTTKVFGMGDLIGHWRKFVTEAGPAALDYFPVGDCLVRTNPLYGRGCSFAAVAAFLLAETLDEARSAGARARLYQEKVTKGLRPYFEAMRNQDRAAIKRAAQVKNPTPKKTPTLGQKIARSFGEDGVAIAMRSEPDLLRAAMRDFHMLDKPGAWMRRPANLAKIVRWWATAKPLKADRYAGAQTPGPERLELFGALSIPAG